MPLYQLYVYHCYKVKLKSIATEGQCEQETKTLGDRDGYELYGERTSLRTEIRRTLLGEQINLVFS